MTTVGEVYERVLDDIAKIEGDIKRNRRRMYIAYTMSSAMAVIVGVELAFWQTTLQWITAIIVWAAFLLVGFMGLQVAMAIGRLEQIRDRMVEIKEEVEHRASAPWN